MSEFKGTRGKWEISVKTTKYETEINTETHRVCECKHYDSKITELLEPTKEEGLYNALLISKAPEMLEMLNKLLISFDWISNNCLLPIIKSQEDADAQIEHIGYNIQEIQQLIKQATEL